MSDPQQPFDSLRDKHIVVVGDGSGIGRAITENLVSLGARFTIASRNARKLQATGASLPVQRVGSTREVAEAVLFLMTNVYTTDGGHMIRQYASR